MSHQEFLELMERVRSGCDEAVKTLFSLCNRQIIREVRRRMRRDMRNLYDSQDFAQAVWKSFYAKLPELSEFDGPQPLIAFLTRVAHNKVVDLCRQRYNTQKRDPKREQAADQSSSEAFIDRRATPSEQAIANEQFDRLVEGQPSFVAKIADCRRQGMSVKEIAEQLGISPAKTRRIVDRLKSRAEREKGRDSDHGYS